MAEQPYEPVDPREPTEHAIGRLVGIFVFLAGIVMLVLAFILAYRAFHDPNLIITLDELRNVPSPNPTATYVAALLRLLLLFVMGYLGSLIAARGANLFFSARKEIHRGTTGR
jgi:hypothetical protein